MDIRQLARIDLNLLLTLQVLLEEESVSKTAEKLFLTQPAISKSLSRLRELFNDPLFTRSGRGLVATPYARSLKEPLSDILGGMENLFVAESFDPATWQGEITIAINEFMDMVLIPLIVEVLAREAPGMHVTTLTQQEDQLSGLEKGELDFALNLAYSEIPTDFYSDSLLKVSPALFGRKNHPLMNRKDLSFDDLVKYPRVALNVPDMDKLTIFQPSRSGTGLRQWKSSFDTENLITALAVISRSDFLLPGSGLIKYFATKDLQFEQLPFDSGPNLTIEYCLIYHDRVARSPAHQWFREKINLLVDQIKV